MDIDIREIEIRDLRPNNGEVEGLPRNPRKISKKNLEKLKKSVQDAPEMLRLRELIVVPHGDGFVVIAGNQRLEAAKAVGMEKLPCKVLPADTDPTKLREYAIKNNLPFGEDDWEVIASDWDTAELEEWGMSVPEQWKDNPTAEEDDFDADSVKESVCNNGDIWQLGDHRLMCGDSTSADDVAKLMNGERADMTFSDSPYNVDFNGSMSDTTKNGVMIKHKGANTRHDAIHNDKMNKEDFFNFMMKILENIKANVTGAWYLSFSSTNLEELLNPLRASGMDWKSIIIWMKNQATLSMKDYKSRYEPIVYGRFNDAWYGNRGFEEDIWEYQRTLKNDLHPTMKPVPLIGKMVQDGSKDGGTVLDLFGGSGSTMIAAEQINRKCYMMELDPHYCDVIIARWEKLTGKKATKIN